MRGKPRALARGKHTRRFMRIVRYLLGAVVVAGCSNGIPPNQAIQDRVALESFDSCGKLEQYIEDSAVLDMRAQIEMEKQGWYFWGLRGGVVLDAAGAPSTPSGPSAYTTTNTQVAGVDEADFVKNDGTRIFVLSGDTLYLNQSWPADQLHGTGKLQLEGWPREMYLDGNTVLVFSTIWYPYPFADQAVASMVCAPMWCGYYYGNTTKVTVVDVSDMSAPRVTGEFFQPGSYTSSRRMGDSVRMVMADSFRYPPGVKLWPDYDPAFSQDHDLWVRALDALEGQNERAIRDATIDQWLPHSFYRDAGGVTHDLGYSCSEFHKTNAPTKLGITTVGTINLGAAAIAANGGAPPLRRTSVIAEPGEIYASQGALYVASGHWWWWPEPGQQDYTYIHKFDLTDPGDARYVASGGVEGHIVDQYAMDENADGFFRVATTIATRRADPNNPQNLWGVMDTTNRVSVLGERSGTLEVVGRSAEIGAGEAIRSARFIGNKGFVVTARQTDPFFTFDLSDPANPTQVGELQVPGFSSYLHPIDDNTILALGVYTDPNGQNWQERSIRLSLYDISDFAHPREASTQLVGTAYGWSQALWDPHAFNYFGAKKLLAIPFWDYTGNGSGNYWDWYTSDLRVFGVDPAAGFTVKGSLDMGDVYMSSSYNQWTWYWRPWVSRSVMADDFVYAISDAGIRVANVNSLSVPLATALFEHAVVDPPAPK